MKTTSPSFAQAARAAAFCLLLTAAPLTIPAQVVISTLSSTVFGGVTLSATAYKAQPFLTPTTGSYELQSVTLNFANAANTSGNLFVSIMQGDLATGPDDGLSSFYLTGTANPSTAGNYTFTAANQVLAANTTYWIVAGVSSGSGSYRWNASTAAGFYETAFTSQPDAFAQSSNGGALWSVSTGASSNPYLFSVSAVAVPEPSTYAALAGVAALGLALWRRRRAAAA